MQLISIIYERCYGKSFVSFCRLMKAQTLGDTSSLEFMRGRRILEVNPDHPIVKDLKVSVLLNAG